MSSVLGNGKVRKDQTDHYGRIKKGGGGGATINDFEDSNTVEFFETENGKVSANVDANKTFVKNIEITSEQDPPYENVISLEDAIELANYYLNGYNIIVNAAFGEYHLIFNLESVNDETASETKQITMIFKTSYSENSVAQTLFEFGLSSEEGEEEFTEVQSIMMEIPAPAPTSDDFADSESIVWSEDEEGFPKADLDADITNKISRSLVTPLSPPTVKELVAIGTDGSQARLQVKNELIIDGTTSPYTLINDYNYTPATILSGEIVDSDISYENISKHFKYRYNSNNSILTFGGTMYFQGISNISQSGVKTIDTGIIVSNSTKFIRFDGVGLLFMGNTYYPDAEADVYIDTDKHLKVRFYLSSSITKPFNLSVFIQSFNIHII